MLKLITFIGTGNYSDTTYTCAGREITTKYFPVVATQLADPGKVIVVKTREATEKHWESLLSEFKNKGYPDPEPLDIPDGQNTGELWEIFNRLIDRVDEGDSVVFDITHSFRSLPVVCFLSVAYLKFVKNIRIEALYYGAFEARDKEKNISPVFDLTGFCTLLDWIVGVNAFVNHGSAVELGWLLAEAQAVASREQGPARRELAKFGRLITEISEALFTTRPFEVMRKTAALAYYNEGTEQRSLLERDVREWAVPFGALMDKLIKEYSVFAGTVEKLDPGSLTKHLAMADWYIRRGYIPQALTVMRELLISEKMRWLGTYDRVLEPGEREDIGSAFYDLIRSGNLPGQLWSRLGDLRNDVNHAGWRKDTRAAGKVIRDTRECYRMLEEIMASGGASFPGEQLKNVEDTAEVLQGTLLITPLGISRGLLYSALEKLNPDFTLVITSDEGRGSLQEILARAEYNRPVAILEVEDPFAGFGEVDRISEDVMNYLETVPVRDIYLNLTGGTTALQYMITGLEERFRDRKKYKVTKVALVDRRPSVEQQENPYVVGEMVVLGELNTDNSSEESRE